MCGLVPPPGSSLDLDISGDSGLAIELKRVKASAFPQVHMIQGLVQSRVLIPSQTDHVGSGRHAWLLCAVLRDRLKGQVSSAKVVIQRELKGKAE